MTVLLMCFSFDQFSIIYSCGNSKWYN